LHNLTSPDDAGEGGALPQSKLLAGLGAALFISAVVLFFATSSWLVALAFVLAAGVLLGGVVLYDRVRAAPAGDGPAAPDWSVTVAAIERAGEAIAITDRANRMVCANRFFLDSFGAGAAPPALPFGREALEAVTLLARNAWREGQAGLDDVEASDEIHWQVSATRAGRGDDHLIWRLKPIARARGADLGALDLAGPFGKMLSRAGIETAITTADGVIRAVSAGFAERAAGDERATLAGQDFVSFLRSDERDRIFFAREGRPELPVAGTRSCCGHRR
jgi:two-component system cell cycle sensor histidine kinase/response regulator CckA